MISYKEFKNMTQEQLNKLRENSSKVFAQGYDVCVGKRVVAVPLDLIVIPKYQRKVKLSRAIAICKEWDMNKCQMITIAYMDDGFFYVVDGQHRCKAAEEKGLFTVPCEISQGLTFKECCRIFADQGKKRKSLDPYDSFYANLLCDDGTAESNAAKDLYEVCKQHNIEILCKEDAEPGDLSSVCSPMSIARKRDGRQRLEFVFGILADSYFYLTKSGMASDVVLGIEQVYTNFPDKLDFARKLLTKELHNMNYVSLQKAAISAFDGYERRAAIKAYMCKLVEDALAKEPVRGKGKKGTI